MESLTRNVRRFQAVFLMHDVSILLVQSLFLDAVYDIR